MKSKAILGLIIFTAGFYAGCTTDESSDAGGSIKFGTPLAGDLTAQYGAVLPVGDYLVVGHLTVPEGASFKINAGTRIMFDNLGEDANSNGILDDGEDANSNGELDDSLCGLTVKGKLEVDGELNNNVVFTSISGAEENGLGDFGQWRAIIFDTQASEAAGDTSYLEYCKILYGATTDTFMRYPPQDSMSAPLGWFVTGAVFIYNCSPIIRNCIIAENGYHGIYILGEDADPYIVNNTIYNNDGDGIRPEDASMVSPPTRIEYNACKENNGLQFGTLLRELGFGINDTVNYNLDSCDLYHNIILEPLFKDEDGFKRWDSLYSCSACIDAGKSGVDVNDPDPTPNIGAIPYTYPYGANEIRRRITNPPLTGGTYHVTCNAFIEASRIDFSITDAEILFDGVYQFDIYGSFTTESSAYRPDPLKNPASQWKGMIFKSSTGPGSYVRDCVFEEASTPYQSVPYGGAITIQGASPEISDNQFISSVFAAISCVDLAQPDLLRNHLNGFGTVGISCFNNSHPNLVQNEIHGGTGNAIWCSGFSSPYIAGNLIYDNDVVGIRIENQSSPLIVYNTLTDNRYGGIKCYVVSDPDSISNNIIALNGNAIYGCGITAEGSSLSDPLNQITYNDIFQPEGVLYGGFTPWPDTLTNLNVDPLFTTNNSLTLFGGKFYPEEASLDTASFDNRQLGVYGYQP